MLETKRYTKEMEEKFPIGEMVTQKYHPNNVGLVASKPKSVRYKDGEIISYVDVLWITNYFYGNGETNSMCCDTIKIRKEKKVV